MSSVACLVLILAMITACGGSDDESAERSTSSQLTEAWAGKHLRTSNGIIDECYRFTTFPGTCTFHQIYDSGTVTGPHTATCEGIKYSSAKFVKIECSAGDDCTKVDEIDDGFLNIMETTGMAGTAMEATSPKTEEGSTAPEIWKVGDGLCDDVVSTEARQAQMNAALTASWSNKHLITSGQSVFDQCFRFGTLPGACDRFDLHDSGARGHIAGYCEIDYSQTTTYMRVSFCGAGLCESAAGTATPTAP